MWRALYRLLIYPGSVVATYCVPVGRVQLPLTLPLIKPARFHARYRHTKHLLVEEFHPKVEIKGTEHLRYPHGLVRRSGAYPPAPTVDQPVLPALLESVAQAPEMALAESKKFSRSNTT